MTTIPAALAVAASALATAGPRPAAPIWRDLASPHSHTAWLLESLGDDGPGLSLSRRWSLLRRFEAPHRNRIGALSSVDGVQDLRLKGPRLAWRGVQGVLPSGIADGFSPQATLSASSTLAPRWAAPLVAFPVPTPRGFFQEGLELTAPRRLPRLPLPLLPVVGPTAPVDVPVDAAPTCAPWQRPRTIRFIRFGTEAESFRLLDCGGTVASDAMDRLSVLARPPGVPRPPLPLPLEPAAPGTKDLMAGEWVPGVRLLHPRLLWALQQLAQRFRWRTFYLVSGYRRHDHGNHHRGRAIDLKVIGVDNADLFRACQKLPDVGCGFYPNSRFVHVDVRAFGSGHPYWVDAAEPGEPSRYVDSWPGVVDGGALRFRGER